MFLSYQFANDLAGVKVHRGPHNVVEGGAIVLTLKDQSILVGGDINEDAFGLMWQTLICLRILKLESRSDEMRHARLRRRK